MPHVQIDVRNRHWTQQGAAVSRNRWKDYWSRQTDPGHTEETDEHYHSQAAELRLLFADRVIDRVLEVGCGNGALYRHLGFDQAHRYLGVDFSLSMLAEFRSRFPPVELVAEDAERFCSVEKFDLIFSNQIAQYWCGDQLGHHLDCAKRMLADDGIVVIAGIPWSRMRWSYARGDLTGGYRRSLPAAVVDLVKELLARHMGTWYDYPEIQQLAALRGLSVRFYGSLHYPYRFHAVLHPHVRDAKPAGVARPAPAEAEDRPGRLTRLIEDFQAAARERP